MMALANDRNWTRTTEMTSMSVARLVMMATSCIHDVRNVSPNRPPPPSEGPGRHQGGVPNCESRVGGKKEERRARAAW